MNGVWNSSRNNSGFHISNCNCSLWLILTNFPCGREYFVSYQNETIAIFEQLSLILHVMLLKYHLIHNDNNDNIDFITNICSLILYSLALR